jgi:hypothetical protein
MSRLVGTGMMIFLAFAAGFLSHVLYQRWTPVNDDNPALKVSSPQPSAELLTTPGQPHRVSYVPLSPPTAEAEPATAVPSFVARDVERIRAVAGHSASVRGRVFRVGHAAKSNTYFLNFGPSREALTAVIFSSAVDLFEKNQLSPKHFENKEVEITGRVKEHPQYGLEIILEHPKQIKILK